MYRKKLIGSIEARGTGVRYLRESKVADHFRRHFDLLFLVHFLF